MLRVVCVVIIDKGRLFLARRSEKMHHPLKWELPGGKMKKGEDEETALKREILEELNVQIKVIEILPSVECYDNDTFIELIPLLSVIADGEIVAEEHIQIGWFTKNQLSELDILAADVKIIQRIKRQLWS